ncbi:hypothetical protein GCT13_27245 [Paraburkholderia sp. CNPSo 3157]|uniref:Uncharacterized protein n=1 Tax=Paraburkholderia franconis TaxID=2654983 RepID=A0A7X1NEG2_9BURK|nr:hypothetical protein [Paraburkholderia franconis]
MTNAFPDTAQSKSIRTVAIVAVATFALIPVCGVGIAAFSGLLPASDGVAVAVTATPIVDMQVDLWRIGPITRIRPASDDGEPDVSVE